MNFVVDPLSEKGQIKTGSTQECQKKCDGVLHCQFWTWNKETQICEYKNVTKGMSPTSRKNLQVVSGPKFCSVYFLFLNTTLLSSSLKNAIRLS